MTRYRTDPAGVQQTLKATGDEANGFAPDLEPMAGHAQAVAAACGNSGAIVPALADFFAYEQRNLEAMTARISACLTGAAAATMAYVNGDEEMMTTYQTNASRSTISEIPERER